MPGTLLKTTSQTIGLRLFLLFCLFVFKVPLINELRVNEIRERNQNKIKNLKYILKLYEYNIYSHLLKNWLRIKQSYLKLRV